MSAGAVVAIIAICFIVTGLFLGNVSSLLMIAELDRKRDNRSLDSRFAFTRRATLRTFREYRSSCPDGKLHLYSLAGYAIALIGMVVLISLGVYSILRNQPIVRITSPADGAIFTAPANIIISVDASEGNYSVSRVDFYQGTTLIGSSTTAAYSDMEQRADRQLLINCESERRSRNNNNIGCG